MSPASPMAVIPSSILISQASNVFVSIPKADLGRTLGCDESSDFIADVYKQAQQSPGSPVLAAQVDVMELRFEFPAEEGWGFSSL
ncbi:hypothetical protein [Synechococcus sp. UW140]|uniref:hypothetical protein n=1 Tax=Synechococcus sp. UW140 TaxID=368503 RepID=UPI0010BD2857|nr:hypothetical protein [Synechococcus sp. UW140]